MLMMLFLTMGYGEQTKTSEPEQMILRDGFGCFFHHDSVVDCSSSEFHHSFFIPFLNFSGLAGWGNQSTLDDVMKPCKANLRRRRRAFGRFPIHAEESEKTNEPKENDIVHHNILNITKQCEVLARSASRIVRTRQEAALRIEKKLTQLVTLIPDQGKAPASRRKRALLSGLQPVFSSIFGFASEDDLAKIQDHMKILENGTKVLFDDVHEIEGQLESLSKTTNDRFDNAMRAIQMNKDTLEQTLAITGAISDMLSLMDATLIYMDHFKSVEEAIDDYTFSIQSLLNGRLPMGFISIQQLKKVLDHAQEVVSAKFPSFSVAHTAPSYYYTKQDVIFSKTKNGIVIMIKIPLRNSNALVHLYTVQTIPVSLNSSSLETTKLTNMPSYFAINSDSTLHGTFTPEQMSTCKGDTLKTCSATLIMRPTSQPTCTLAVFEDRPKLAHKLCKANYQQSEGLLEGGLHISGNDYLISTSEPRIEMICLGKPPKSIPGRPYAVVKLPCGCGLRAEKFTISPKVTSCNFTNQVTYEYVNNIIGMHALFDVDSPAVRDITSVTRTRRMTQATLPAFQAYSKRAWKGVIQSEQNYEMDFHKMVVTATTNKKMFKTQGDALSHELDQAKLASWTFNDPMGLINNILTLICTIACIYLLCRRNNPFAVIPPVAMTGGVGAMIIDNTQKSRDLSLKPRTWPKLPNYDGHCTQLSSLKPLLIIFFYLMLILVLCEIFRLVKWGSQRIKQTIFGNKQTAISTLWLQLENESKFVRIKISKLPVADSELNPDDFIVPQLVSLAFTGRILSIDWLGHNIIRTGAPHRTYFLPSNITVGFLQYLRIRKLIQGPYNVLFFIECQGFTKEIKQVDPMMRDPPPPYDNHEWLQLGRTRNIPLNRIVPEIIDNESTNVVESVTDDNSETEPTSNVDNIHGDPLNGRTQHESRRHLHGRVVRVV